MIFWIFFESHFSEVIGEGVFYSFICFEVIGDGIEGEGEEGVSSFNFRGYFI